MRFLLLFVPFFLFGLEFKVASYNVENLFDATKNGNEYKEYTPNTKHGWNEAMVERKIAHIAQVIGDMNADVIALAEVENKEVLERLNKALGAKAYPYLFFPKKKERVSIESALLSRFPIVRTESFFMKDQPRGIHRITLNIEHHLLDVYINHWPAHKEKEAERLVYATTLKNVLLKEKGKAFILLGDFNSPYRVQKEDWGLGFATVLGVGDKTAPLYNTWYDLPQNERYSHSYGKQKTALDHIVIAPTLYDNKGIEYKPNSLKRFEAPYMLDENGNPKRWQISQKGKGEHLGEGYSDHFPVTAIFHTLKD
ncbi:endonuclease/exonuclease/phosphatase family protein [Sulfurospirillum barnesii]|uniref:Putative extracellular nuclease n=1 Tax=Sulfurospirillum barnesii (strain ATCC 700032 / DSM 10660 / SES-3) TaxID=760154 RepID=I3XY17_SULBS|nr:endonuclease/exonuclease/phosphatase family protein [Sulfurospirillum barnesii]AFL68841.1 putative extracellular nuclease [Sulfurospirillum barnesii SES-3]